MGAASWWREGAPKVGCLGRAVTVASVCHPRTPPRQDVGALEQAGVGVGTKVGPWLLASASGGRVPLLSGSKVSEFGQACLARLSFAPRPMVGAPPQHLWLDAASGVSMAGSPEGGEILVYGRVFSVLTTPLCSGRVPKRSTIIVDS